MRSFATEYDASASVGAGWRKGDRVSQEAWDAWAEDAALLRGPPAVALATHLLLAEGIAEDVTTIAPGGGQEIVAETYAEIGGRECLIAYASATAELWILTAEDLADMPHVVIHNRARRKRSRT